MGLYFLNISVDVADPHPEHVMEDLSYNDQESIIELVVEKVMGVEDCFPEYDDHDMEDHNKRTSVKLVLALHYLSKIHIQHSSDVTARTKFAYLHTFWDNAFVNLDIPPPKG